MLRHLLIGVLVGLFATSGCAGPQLVVHTDRGQVVPVDLPKVQPVEYGKAEFQEAMGLFADHVAAVIQSREGRLRVRLASSDPMTEAYLAWCDRRNAPGDCLELLDAKSPGISNDGKRSIAVRMALGTALEEAASVVRHVDPVKVEALLLIWFTIYFAALVFPDVTITKAVAFVMSAKLAAFLGWDGFRSFVLGYRDMCKAADAAQTFPALYDAGRTYGNRMGPSMVRIVTTLVTLGLSSATGMSVPVTRLPGGAQAVANGEAMGFRLSAVSGGSISVSAAGTITVVLANEATNPERGGSANAGQGEHGARSQPPNRDELEARKRELGTDVRSGQYRPGEADAALRLEKRVGPLKRDPTETGDWVDSRGKIYDGVGPVPAGRFRFDEFVASIRSHLLKSGVDFVVVDTSSLVTEEAAQVNAFVARLSTLDRARIILQ